MLQRALMALGLGAALLVGPTQVQAEGEFVFQLSSPLTEARQYRETFPTEVNATAALWNQLKVDALQEQTQALKLEFERVKAVRFLRGESIANRKEMQPSHLPALNVARLRF